MDNSQDLVPVLQLENLAALEAARDFLTRKGYQCRVGPFHELPPDQQLRWMKPVRGGYLLYLEQTDRYKSGMELLEEFFGCDE